MGKIRKAIAEFFRSRRPRPSEPRPSWAYQDSDWPYGRGKDCRHIWGVKRDPAFGFPIDGSEAVCVYCGVTASAQEGTSK